MSNILKKKRSEIWNFFKVHDSEYAICDFCKLKICYRSTVTNMKKHLQRKHPSAMTLLPSNSKAQDLVVLSEAEFNEESIEIRATGEQSKSDENQNGLFPASMRAATPSPSTSAASHQPPNKISKHIRQSSMTGFIPAKITPSLKQKINDELMKLFTIDLQPFSVVEDKGFRAFVKALNPSYALPSRKTIANSMLPVQYEKCGFSARAALKEATSVCLTTDCWTSTTADSYLALTAHFVSENFEMQSVLLECCVMNTSHTSENLAAELARIVRHWDLENKILLAVSDNAANIKRAVTDILKWNFFGCFAHKLNLIVSNSLNGSEVEEILTTVRKVVGHFKKSPTSTAKFLENQTKDSLQPKKLVQEVATRWNSTYLMLQRFCELENYVKSTIAVLDKDVPILTNNQWKIAKELCMILKPFFLTTESISGEKYETASLVIVLSNGLYDICLKLKKKPLSAETLKVVTKLEQGITDRLGNVGQNTTLATAMFLDPRFKGCFQDTKLEEHTKDQVIRLVTQKMKAASRNIVQTENTDQARTEYDELSPWASVDRCFSNAPKTNESARSIIEVRRYLEEPSLDRKKDPLEWWRRNSYNFPFLSKVFKERFCCLATSVPCERLFSKSGYVLNDRRTRLRPSKVKEIMFVNTNIKFV